MQRLQSIQVLRGLAALAVFAFHLGATLNRYTDLPLRSWVDRGQMGVDLFFVISGFVMVYSVRELAGFRDASTFLFRRFWRIAPPLYALTVAHLLFKSLYRVPVEFGQIVNCFTILPVMTSASRFTYALIPAWTLGFEAAFYLLVAAIVALNPRSRVVPLAMAVALAPALPLAWPHALSPFASPMMIEFAFGVAAFALWERGMITVRIAVLSAVVAGILMVFPLPGGRVAEWGAPMALLFVSALRWKIGDGRLQKALLWLGTISYSLYLSHVVSFDALVPVFAAFLPLPLVAIALAAAGLWIAAFAYGAVERPLMSARIYRRGLKFAVGKGALAPAGSSRINGPDAACGDLETAAEKKRRSAAA